MSDLQVSTKITRKHRSMVHTGEIELFCMFTRMYVYVCVSECVCK